MRPPEFNEHAEKIKDYIYRLGLYGLLTEISFALSKGEESDSEALSLVSEFQNKLSDLQQRRIDASNGEKVLPIGVIE